MTSLNTPSMSLVITVQIREAQSVSSDHGAPAKGDCGSCTEDHSALLVQVLEAELRATKAELKVSEAERLISDLQHRTSPAEQTAAAAERRAAESASSDRRAIASEKKLLKAEREKGEAEVRATGAEKRAKSAERQLTRIMQDLLEAAKVHAPVVEQNADLVAQADAIAAAEARLQEAKDRAAMDEATRPMAEHSAIGAAQPESAAYKKAAETMPRQVAAAEAARHAKNGARAAEEAARKIEGKAGNAESRTVAAEDRLSNAVGVNLAGKTLINRISALNSSLRIRLPRRRWWQGTALRFEVEWVNPRKTCLWRELSLSLNLTLLPRNTTCS